VKHAPSRLRVLVTAGPTREHVDPVRYLTNESSGRMGFAIAAEAAKAGHQVVLVAGPVSPPTAPGVERSDVVSAPHIVRAVGSACRWSDLWKSAVAGGLVRRVRARGC